jgi:3-methyladenine DNA glycosylase AlkD
MLDIIYNEVQQFAVPVEKRKAVFFKTGPGEYAEHDKFLGVPTPHLRDIAKRYRAIDLEIVIELLQSPVNEVRLLALMMLVERYQKGDAATQEEIFKLYQSHMNHINNWNLVDASAHHIIGAHIYQRDKVLLLQLSSSPILWERRIAIVSTLFFIRQNEFTWTVQLAKKLLNDREDLIHKAVGWMLREMGKRDQMLLILFLDKYAKCMPRTMLRYAIEKLNDEQKKKYMSQNA